MSRYISDLNVAEFDRDVKQEYSHMPMMKELVRVKTGVVGSTCRFQKSAQGLANKKVPQADVVPMNIDYSWVETTLEDWNAPEYTDIFSAPKINFDERSELVSLSAKACGRRDDQIIIDALALGATKLKVATSIGDTDGMNTAKFRDAKRQLDYYNVPADSRAFVMSTEALSDMLADNEANNRDTASLTALVAGEIKNWLGFRVYTIGFMPEGGMPLDGTTRSAFAFDKASLGYANGMGMHSEINYIANKTSWLVNTLFSASAVAIDNDGMVTISHIEA